MEWATDAIESTADATLDVTESSSAPKELPSNPYLDIPTPIHSQDFKKGYIMRKCCMEPNGKRTTLGKRSWKMYFAVLKDLILYLYKVIISFETPAPNSQTNHERENQRETESQFDKLTRNTLGDKLSTNYYHRKD